MEVVILDNHFIFPNIYEFQLFFLKPFMQLMFSRIVLATEQNLYILEEFNNYSTSKF